MALMDNGWQSALSQAKFVNPVGWVLSYQSPELA